MTADPTRTTCDPVRGGVSAQAGPLLVALDIDGTVVDTRGRLSDRVRRAVRDVARSGVHVVLATGRDVNGARPVLDRLGLDSGWIVCSNGAVVARFDPLLPNRYEIVEAVTFDTAPVLALLRAHLPDALYAVEEVGRGLRLSAPFPTGELDGDTRVVPFDELAIPSSRVVVRSPDRSLEDFVALVERVGLRGVTLTVGWSTWLDVAPEGVTKATGLETVRRALDVDPSATLAVGDWSNDLDMFAWAGRSVAMGQGLPEVLAAADQITGSVTDDGLADVLEALPPSTGG